MAQEVATTRKREVAPGNGEATRMANVYAPATDIFETEDHVVLVADMPGDDPKDHVFFVVDEDVCTRCALCVDRCPTGVIILGKVTDDWADGDPNVRTNRHGYAYGVRF